MAKYRTFCARTLVALLLLGPLVGGLNAPAQAAESTAPLNITGQFRYDYAYEALAELNSVRAAGGLAPLTMDETLLDAAMQRAVEQAILFGHTRPDGSRGLYIVEGVRGENVASGYRTPQEVTQGWRNSEGHYKNMMTTNNSAVGIGCFHQGGTIYWVQLFGELKTTATQPQTAVDKQAVVNASPEILTLKLELPSSLFLEENGTVSLSANGVQLTPGSYTLESSNPSIVRPNADGSVTAVYPGSATITARLGGASAAGSVQATFFSDVAAGSDSFQAIRTCYQKGWMSGVSEERFGTQEPLSRAMAVVVLYRMAGSPAVSQTVIFSDVSLGQWYSDAINWASQNGIVRGHSENYFNRDGQVTRGEFLTILHRYAAYRGQDTTGSASLDRYQDAAYIPDWAQNSLRWAESRGLLESLPTGNGIEADKALTRGQCAALLVAMN